MIWYYTYINRAIVFRLKTPFNIIDEYIGFCKRFRPVRRKIMLNDLKKLISMPTVLNEGENGTPFGQSIADALQWFASRAEELGLKAYCDRYYAYAETADGDEDNMIGIAAHLDVVPVNADDWATDPFELVEKDGVFYGRGVADDKGPAVICLHVLAELNKFRLKHKIRMIVGGDEETASRGLKKYCAEQKLPVCTLVPDADFPLINSEKGILHLNFTSAVQPSYGIVELSGGQRTNMVPDHCVLKMEKSGEAMLAAGDLHESILKRGMNASDFRISEQDDIITVQAFGTAGHASTPEAGDNAIAKIFRLLTPLIEFDKLDKFITGADAKQNLGLDISDEAGDLTMNAGIVSFADNKLNVSMDFRLPLCVTPERVQETLFKNLRPENIVVDKYAPNLFVSPDSKLVRTLLRCYSAVTGDHSGAQKTGGGTYARELPNAVAFGPVFPGTETNLHNANESIPVNHLEKLYEIYLKSIAALDKEL